MTRKQIAFRLDEEKAKRLEEKRKKEGKSLNTVLERLVDTYLEGTLTDDNSTVTPISDKVESNDSSAIALLTERIAKLEKMLTPVTDLLTFNTKLASANTANTELPPANSEESANTELPPANSEESANTELPPANTEVTDANSEESANTELPPANTEVTDANSELTGANSEVTGANSELTGANSELTGANTEVTDANSELTGANSEVTGGNSENLDHPTENIPSESTLETTKPTSQDKNHLTETELPQKAKTEDNLSEGINSKDFLKDSEESAIAASKIEDLAKDDELQRLIKEKAKATMIGERLVILLKESGLVDPNCKEPTSDIMSKIKKQNYKRPSDNLMIQNLYHEALEIAKNQVE